MKKLLSLAASMLFSLTGIYAMPVLQSLDNLNGKTTIRVGLTSDESGDDTVTIRDAKLNVNGKVMDAKSVKTIRNGETTLVFQFKKLTRFENCVLTFMMNGTPVSVNVSEALNSFQSRISERTQVVQTASERSIPSLRPLPPLLNSGTGNDRNTSRISNEEIPEP